MKIGDPSDNMPLRDEQSSNLTNPAGDHDLDAGYLCGSFLQLAFHCLKAEQLTLVTRIAAGS
jgi:hypothetical protein